MKKYSITTFTKITLFVFGLCTTIISAQTDLPDAPDDTTPAPIDDYVWVMVLVAVSFAILKFIAIYKQGLHTEK